MQAVEIAVFLMASVIIGGMIIMFVMGFSPGRFFSEVRKLFFPPSPIDQNALLQFSTVEAAGYLNACWHSCGFGAFQKACGVIAIKGTGAIQEQDFLAVFERYALCKDCNLRFAPSPLELPVIVRVICDENVLRVEG